MTRVDATPVATPGEKNRLRTGELAAYFVLMLGGSFLPGFVIAVFVVAVLAIIHLAQ